MCHETTSVALKKTIGVGVGTVVFDDLAKSRRDVLLRPEPRLEQPALPASRCRTQPSAASQIVTFNPIREKGLIEFINPQSPTEMLTGKATRISTQYHQVKAGRRHRRDARPLQARLRGRRCGQGRGQARARRRVHRAAHQRLRGVRGHGSGDSTGARSNRNPG